MTMVQPLSNSIGRSFDSKSKSSYKLPSKDLMSSECPLNGRPRTEVDKVTRPTRF